jgi:NAD(P)-dependent dehydrogenase (short-subunit alcohol dehydrogenase family)
MTMQNIQNLYDLSGQTAIITGGAGVLCTAICRSLAALGLKIAVLDVNLSAAESLAAELNSQGGKAIAVLCDVLDKTSLELAASRVTAAFKRVDILINGAGGNKQQATTSADVPFFDLPVEALRWVFDLNLLGTILASQVFGKIMAKQKSGIILNISSMNSYRPLTRVPAYSAAKAGVSNFTQWLAVHMAKEYSSTIRVNAIAPGFFLTEQNRFLLTDKATGDLTPRGKSIIDHTPMGRFGTPDDLLGTVLWLISPASAFTTGIVVPVDGGFSAYSGV